MGKKMSLVSTAKTINLKIERDAGNDILILMGNRANAIKNFEKLESLCAFALKELSLMKYNTKVKCIKNA